MSCVLARVLRDAGLRVRVLVPTAQSGRWPAGVEVMQGSILDPTAAEAAFTDIDRAFLAGLAGVTFDQMRELANLLLGGPLARVVVLSSHGSDFETVYSTETWEWLAFERAMELHDVTLRYLRPGGLFASAVDGGYPITGSDWFPALAEDRPVREFLPEVAYPFLDEADCAEIAATLLVDEALAGGPRVGTLDVIGCLTSARGQLESINALLGQHLRLEALCDQDDARAYWRAQGWPEDTIEVTLYAMTAFRDATTATHQVVSSQIATAERLLGRPPHDFCDWLLDHPDLPSEARRRHRTG